MNYGIYNEKLTIILVSFHSNHIIENLINILEKNIRIIVVENSLNKEIKPYLEKKFLKSIFLLLEISLENISQIFS